MSLFYGPKGNHNLVEMCCSPCARARITTDFPFTPFARYGFALLDNPFNCAMMYPKYFDKHTDAKHRMARMLGADLDYGVCVNTHTLSPALYTVSAIAVMDPETMSRSRFLQLAAAPHTHPPLLAKVVNNLLEGLQVQPPTSCLAAACCAWATCHKTLQAAARPEEAIVKDFMHLSLIRRALPGWGASTSQFAEM